MTLEREKELHEEMKALREEIQKYRDLLEKVAYHLSDGSEQLYCKIQEMLEK